MPDETEGGVEKIELLPATSLLGIKIPSIQACVGIDELDGSVELGLCVAGDTKDAEKITPGADTPNGKDFCIEVGPVKLDIGFEADNAAGEAHVKGQVSVRDPILEQFHEVAEVDECIYYSPAHGSVGGDTEPHPPRVKDPEYGESRMSSKNVTRIFVEDRKRLVADVGRVAKNELWKDEPDWVFNTVACVGPFDDRGLGSYSDPRVGLVQRLPRLLPDRCPQSGLGSPLRISRGQGSQVRGQLRAGRSPRQVGLELLLQLDVRRPG